MKPVQQIVQTSPTSYFLKIHSCEMTLEKKRGGWVMYTVNAMVKAYRGGYAVGRDFADLGEVEAHYKTWRGIKALVESSNQTEITS